MLPLLLACGITSVPKDEDANATEASWTCDTTGTYGPRQIRLLSRREYQNSLLDLFDARSDTSDTSDTSCSYTFSLPDSGYQSAHVAGSFNGWPGTIAGGGLAMQLSGGTWTVSIELEPGVYQYKFVINESTWVTDPTNPTTADDGYGGQNSVLNHSCDGGASGVFAWIADLDLTGGLPPESHPAEFLYDNHAASGLVTPTHMEAYLASAEAIAAQIDVSQLLGCEAEDVACTESWVYRFALRAWRRPVSDAQASRLLALIDSQEDPEVGVRLALTAILASPYFLYRVEVGEDRGDGTYALDSYELASAMSYLYWGSGPDDALLTAAAVGELDTEAGIAAQAERLLLDPRARETMRAFATQWLGLTALDTEYKNTDIFPDFDDSVKAAMVAEAADFVEAQLFEGSFDALLTGNPVGTELATWYGDVGQRAGGILGLGAVAATYAHSDQTAPVQRGLLVRRVLLCQEFGTPPANAGVVPTVDANATTRERFSQHSSDPSCSSCHQYIDEVGFGMENLDAVGRWRAEENGLSVDASGDMNDIEFLGEARSNPYVGVEELAGLLRESERTSACFTVQTMRFTLGWQPEDELCAYDDVRMEFLAMDQSLLGLLKSIPLTQAFRYREEQ